MEKERLLQPIQTKEVKGHGGFEHIKKSSHLKFILCIVVLMQLSSTFIDFYFNTHIQQLFPLKDLRTEYTGKLFGVIHSVNMLLHFIGALFLIEIVGLICLPSFYLVVAAFSTIKACDYSIFTISKEMLYLPLSSEDKFKAKAVFDVFAYRSSKALASFALLTSQLFTITSFDKMLSWALFRTFSLWISSVVFFSKNAFYQKSQTLFSSPSRTESKAAKKSSLLSRAEGRSIVLLQV